MPELVHMPKLGFDMAEGTLVRKVKPEGASVKRGLLAATTETQREGNGKCKINNATWAGPAPPRFSF